MIGTTVGVNLQVHPSGANLKIRPYVDSFHMSISVGQTLAHYKITDRLGAGGMGEVYLALDTRLNRLVALKFLPDALRRDPEARERLLREAQAASQLHHPNILTIHAIESTELHDFIVMEYVPGQRLDEYLQARPRPLDDILTIAVELADALTKAHQAGIIHRDLKPANILVDTDGRARILDFGVAKLAGAQRLTQTGSTLGTMAYMSPEQAQGKPVDHRTDLWSLGVVLYEMIAGRLPFHGEHDAAVLYAITNESPEPLARFKSSVSPELERITSKCLAKPPGERYQSASDLAADLRALHRQTTSGPVTPTKTGPIRRKTLVAVIIVAGVAALAIALAVVPRLFRKADTETSSARKMLAVLPFENLGSSEDEYFADGITEEITTHLAKLSGLGVISRTSTMKYKKTDKTLRQIGSELGVDYVLEGSIRWDKTGGANRVRINPQLIRVKDDTHLWAETYENVLDQIFVLQSNIATKVADALDVALLQPEQRSLASPPTVNPQAYDCYLHGKEHFLRSINASDLEPAIAMLEKAIAIDSNFAPAYARLSQANTELYWHTERRPEYLARARWAADRALSLDPELTDAYIALGSIHYHAHEYDRALSEFRKVLERQPNHTEALAEVGAIQRRQGQWEEAVKTLQRACELNPQDAHVLNHTGLTYAYMRRYGDAETFDDRAILAAPDRVDLYVEKVRLLIKRNGDIASARALLEQASRFGGDRNPLNQVWQSVDAMAGDYDKALERSTRVDSSSVFYDPNVRPFILSLLHQSEMTRASFDSARIILESKTAKSPEEPTFHLQLGMAYAGLGRRDDAVREGQRVQQLAPIATDYYNGPILAIGVAGIYTQAGRIDEAIDQLEYLLSIPSELSVAVLRLDPMWIPLRSHPRFQKLINQPDKVF